MRTRLTALLSIATVALFASTAVAQGKSTMCNDGTTSAVSGRGACSGHRGVKKAEKAAAKADKKEDKAEPKADKKVAKAEEKGVKMGDAPKTVTKGKGAQVTCTDGTMSKPGRGACSGHGGVKKA
jgi:hypothetical protein